MEKKSKYLFLACLTATLAVSAVAVLAGTKHNLNVPSYSTNTVNSVLSFNRANWSNVSVGEGRYANSTSATLSGGQLAHAENTNTVDLTSSTGIAVLSNGNGLSFLDSEWNGLYIQEVTNVNITFTEASNGKLTVFCYRNQGSSEYREFNVVNGEFTGSIPVEGFRRYYFTCFDDTDLEVTSVSFSYSCSYSYVDPLLPEYNREMRVVVSNDFHGYIEETEENLGLKKFGTFFKQETAQENTIWLDQGDSWQGTIYSNMNHGALVNNVMAYAGISARTVGNHDFDWGVDALKANTARVFEYNDVEYTVPTLAANIYDYDFVNKEFGDDQQSDIGAETITYTLENGLKVGVVGVIGEDQITSINSLYTQDIGFKPHIPIIQEKATELRADGCDIVICSIHADQDAVKGQGLENYVDLVLCGHSHQQESFEENGLLYLQAGSNGKTFAEVRLNYNSLLDDVTFSNYMWWDALYLKENVTTIDPVIENLVDTEIAKCNTDGAVTLATGVTGTFATNQHGPNIVAKAIYEYATTVDSVTDLTLAYVNNTRSELGAGTWTFADVYQALPFDNVVYITTITGRELHDEIKGYNWVYTNPSLGASPTFDVNSTYKVAVLDYLLFHTNSSRVYDYFPTTAGAYSSTLTKNYRDIFKWWLGNQAADSINSDDYRSSQTRHNKNSWIFNPTFTVTFDYNYDGAPAAEVVNDVHYGTKVNTAGGTPAREGYQFIGWYRDAGCTQSASKDVVRSARTYYARWGVSYETAQLDYKTILPDTLFTNVQATNPNDAEDHIDLTVNHFWAQNISTSSITDKSNYHEFGIKGNYGLVYVEAPSGYKFCGLEIKIYNTNDNLDFYAGNNGDEEGVQLSESKDTSTSPGNLIYRMSSFLYDIVEIVNVKNYDSSVFYVQFKLVRI